MLSLYASDAYPEAEQADEIIAELIVDLRMAPDEFVPKDFVEQLGRSHPDEDRRVLEEIVSSEPQGFERFKAEAEALAEELF